MATHITRMCCGWEMGTRTGIGSGTTGEWGNSSGTTVTQESSAARSGGYGLRLNASASAPKQARDFNLSQVFVVRFYFRYNSALPGANAHIFYIGAGGGAEQSGFQLRFNQSDSTLRMVELDAVGSVIETATGPSISASTWYRIDVMMKGSGVGSSGLDWQVDGAAQTRVVGSYAMNRVFFGTNTNQTFDLHVDDVYMAYSTDDAGEGGAALIAEYPRGAGEVKRLVATSTSLTDAAKFSMTDGSADTSAHTSMDDDPLIGAPGLRQDTVGTTDYAEFGITDLSSTDNPWAISVVAEGRAVGGGTSNAQLRITKDGTEQTVIGSTNWNNGPQLFSMGFDLPGDSQTTRWTKTQIDGMTVRWGYSADVTNPPIIGGFQVMVDVSVVTGGDKWSWTDQDDSWHLF